MRYSYHCQRHQLCLFPATSVPRAMLVSLLSACFAVIMLATIRSVRYTATGY